MVIGVTQKHTFSLKFPIHVQKLFECSCVFSVNHLRSLAQIWRRNCSQVVVVPCVVVVAQGFETEDRTENGTPMCLVVDL